ncbi:phosphate acyltransferase [Rhizobium sp. YTU87027]|uniref:phosphate acyltransferase n=1 Tax=Rhizobium sp. YTU87027 TaxID=3417741 RepID=UPI003D697AB6
MSLPAQSKLLTAVFDRARGSTRRVIFAEGHDERVLRAVQAMLEAKCAVPMVVGSTVEIARKLVAAGIDLRVGDDFAVVEAQNDHEFLDQWCARKAAIESGWKIKNLPGFIRDCRNTAIAARLVESGKADSMVCGTSGQFQWHFAQLSSILATLRVRSAAALSLLVVDDRPLFLAYLFVDSRPSSKQIAEIAVAAAGHVCAFGLEPKITLCHGPESLENAAPDRAIMATARHLIFSDAPQLEVRGPSTVAEALTAALGEQALGRKRGGRAPNILLFSAAEAATTARDVLHCALSAPELGPLLLGTANRAHIVSPAVTWQGLVNIAAVAGMNIPGEEAFCRR